MTDPSEPVGGSRQARRDLADAVDVGELVRRFYGEVAQDELLGPMFNDVARVDWATHIPKLTQFWCRVLFGTPGYVGNPFDKHAAVHARTPFTRAHFDRWVELFEESLDLRWAGPNVESMKALARSVARVHGEQLVDTAVDRADRTSIAVRVTGGHPTA